jgi:hypothetical protein
VDATLEAAPAELARFFSYPALKHEHGASRLKFCKDTQISAARDRLRVAASRLRQHDKVMYIFLPTGSNRRNRASVSEIPGGLSNSRAATSVA